MTSLTTDQVTHIAKLARLRLSEDEIRTMPAEMSSILKYIEILSELDTENVEPTAQVTGKTNAFREDDVRTSDTSSEDLLGCSPLSIVDNHIAAPNAHG
jgi:aspartyl-tRNA(Asn)/glutamyl-tRNA(Gln) amidotransferase subunit C